MLIIRLFTVLDEVVGHVDLQERSTLGQFPATPPTFVCSAMEPIDLVTDVDGLTRMLHDLIGQAGRDGHELLHQLSC